MSRMIQTSPTTQATRTTPTIRASRTSRAAAGIGAPAQAS